MRRALSILLMLLFGAGPLSFAFTASDDSASLPACCRRHGAHHCAMDDEKSRIAPGRDAIKAPSRCPQFPRHSNARTSTSSIVSALPHLPQAAEYDRTPSFPSGLKSTSIHLRTPVLRGPPQTCLS